MARTLRGRQTADELTKTARSIARACHEKGVSPTLCILRVGARAGDLAYERAAIKRCEQAEICVRVMALEEGCAIESYLAALSSLASDEACHGILIMRPLPQGFDESRVRALIPPEKDVDGMSEMSLSALFIGDERGFPPCTARACIELLKQEEIPMRGKHAVVIGRSLVVGKPLAMLLLNENATVTICHSRTENLDGIAR